MITISELTPAALELTVHGKLHKADYEQMNRLVERKLAAHGKIGMIVRIGDMEGWTPAALWEDLKFDVKHYRDIARFALVGEDWTKNWLATVSEPFTAADIRYFIERDIEGARDWVCGVPASTPERQAQPG